MSANTSAMKVKLVGIGVSGPGFSNWPELQTLLKSTQSDSDASSHQFTTPKPSVIPANERRRAPLPVKIAVEVSEQAIKQSGQSAEAFACVFGSGLGDTQITDYMCRALATEDKLLSPTKFHNSVHNAAAGYWTISTDCMQAANSIAAYHDTVGMSLMEAAAQISTENIPVLVTVFDICAYSAYQAIFDCDQHFGAAVALAPADYNGAYLAELSISIEEKAAANDAFNSHEFLNSLYTTNPSGKMLALLSALIKNQDETTISINDNQELKIHISHA